MKMPNGGDIYDMVFATDHYVGDKIMRHLYDQAAKREPGMMAEAKSLAREEKIAEMGQEPLFETERHDPPVSGSTLWRPEPCWDPKSREWW